VFEDHVAATIHIHQDNDSDPEEVRKRLLKASREEQNNSDEQ
jgi:hypothetical protein